MRTPTIAFLIASAGLCLATSSLPAGGLQPDVPGSPSRSADRAGVQPTPQRPETFDLNFTGGTVGDYLDALASATTVNVVAPAEVRALVMPAVRLRGVSAWGAVQLIENMFIDSSTVGAVQLGVVDGDGTAPIYVLSVVIRNDRPAPPPTSVNEIFAVGDVLRPANDEPIDLQIKKIFQMIDSAMTLAPAELQPELAFHDDTRMLVFRGSPEQRRLIESVLERYHVSWRVQAEQVDRLRQRLAEMRLEAQTSAIEAEAMRSRVAHVTTRLEELEQLQEAGGTSASEVRSAQEDFNRAMADAQVCEARAMYARQQVEAIAHQVSGASSSTQADTVVYNLRGMPAHSQWLSAFNQLIDAAELPGTTLSFDRDMEATLTAPPVLHEAFAYLIEQHRAKTAAGGAQ